MHTEYTVKSDGRVKATVWADVQDEQSMHPNMGVCEPKNFLSRILFGDFDERVRKAKKKVLELEKRIRQDLSTPK